MRSILTILRNNPASRYEIAAPRANASGPESAVPVVVWWTCRNHVWPSRREARPFHGPITPLRTLEKEVRISEVPSYAAFGAQLNCAFELPELDPTSLSFPRAWTVDVRDAPAPSIETELVGIDTVCESVLVRAFVAPGLLRLEFDDTGIFDVRAADRGITWYPGKRPDATAMRADLLGRVMALAAHADGGLALHASAVAIHGHAVGFLGPKHAGKSTLAMALVRRGGRLLTDDTLVLRFDGGVAWATPGVQRVRLWPDSARALGAHAENATVKPTLDRLPQQSLQTADVPLSACYVVAPADAASADLVSRQQLSSIRAAVACVGFSKLGSLAGGEQSAVVLDRAARLTRMIPVYEAIVHRDLTRLDAIADVLLAWHGPRDGAPHAAP